MIYHPRFCTVWELSLRSPFQRLIHLVVIHTGNIFHAMQAKDFSEIIDLHREYVTKIHDRCLLNEKVTLNVHTVFTRFVPQGYYYFLAKN